MKVYNQLKDMEINIGDTIQFNVTVDVEDGTSLNGCVLKLLISSDIDNTEPIITIDGTADGTTEGLYHILLATEDSSKLCEGAYMMYFILVDTEDNEHKKLVCDLYVHSAPRATV